MPAPAAPDLTNAPLEPVRGSDPEQSRPLCPRLQASSWRRRKQAAHGDYACKVALQLAKLLKRAPRDIAAQLVAALPASPYLEKAEIAGAGFINLFLKRSFKQQVVNRILAAGAAYGTSALGRRKKVQVEFVSANPTGPLHVGHGRGAAYGASLANVLAAAGFDVSREYYVNDAGRQMDILALSTWLRYLEAVRRRGARFPPTPTRASTCATWRAGCATGTTARVSQRDAPAAVSRAADEEEPRSMP